MTVPLLLAVAGAATRLTVRHGVETRYQILLFWLVAALVEGAAVRVGGRPSLGRFVAGSIAVAFAIIAVRLHLEGPPHRLMELI